MRWTRSLIPTRKETPAEATIVSRRLMVFDWGPKKLRVYGEYAPVV